MIQMESLQTVKAEMPASVRSLSSKEIPLVVLLKQQEVEQTRLFFHFVEKFLMLKKQDLIRF